MTRPFHAIEFEELRKKAGLSQAEAADLTGLGLRTIQRYETGTHRASPPAVRLLRDLPPKVQPSVEKSDTKFRFIDLFAGIGGLRIGFEEVKGECVFTSEWDKFSKITYEKNFGQKHPVKGDIREFSANPALVPPHNVILAGFPCQPFSLAGVSKKNSLGRPHGFLCDTQGTLFFELARIIEHHKPAAFLLENVKNLKSHDKGRTFATIMHVLENELGYEVHTRVISSAPWVPQKRERIFIVGFRDKSEFNFDELDVPEKGPTLGSILEPNDEVDPKYTLTPKLWDYLKGYKEKHAAAGNGFGYSLFGPGDIARTLSARYHKDGSEILISQGRKRPRRLTPRECARLMGFENPGCNDFQIPVSDTQAYRQFGNAVVVPVVKAIARLMEPHILKAVKAEQETLKFDEQHTRPAAKRRTEMING